MLKKQKLGQADKNFVKKFACTMDSCDENFVFKTTHEKMAAATERELRGEVIGNIKTYQAVCLKCNKKILMSQKNMNKWRKIFTGGEVEIATTKFNDLLTKADGAQS